MRVKARPSGGGWIIRALVRPASWADAASITVVPLSFAGRPLMSDLLPATLRVGYGRAFGARLNLPLNVDLTASEPLEHPATF